MAEGVSAELAERKASRTWEQRLELFGVILLALAGLGTSWCGYQATLWSGVQAASYSEANSFRVDSARIAAHADQFRIADVGMFMNWLEAFATENDDLQKFYHARFRGEFAPAFESWIAARPLLNPDAPPTPFVLPQYKIKFDAETARLADASAQAYEKGQEANEIADNYVLISVILSMVLFFSGFAQHVRSLRLRGALIGIAAVMALIGAYRLATYPVL